MPGGSVNGRPFRESVDSYSRTGIPCGNPKRFRSHDVVRMEPGKKTLSRPLAGPSTETIETEAGKQLQALLQKQMDTKISLKEQLQKRKEFCQGADYRPGTEELVGIVQLEQYKSREQSDSYLDDLRAYGLTNEEILFLLQHEEDEQLPKRSKLGNPEHLIAKMQDIQDRIAKKQREWQQNDSFSGVRQLSRHAMEIEKSISTAGNQSSFLHKMLVKEVDRPGISGEKEDDPMKCLPDILEAVTKRKHRRKARTAAYKADCTLECCNQPGMSHCHTCEQKECDCSCGENAGVPTCMEKPADYVSKLEPETSNDKESKKTEAKGTSFTVKMDRSGPPGIAVSSGSEVREVAFVEPVPEEAIRQYRLSAEDIRKLPRFENYHPGEPTNVLYLKNLSPKVTEMDLASLFVGFQKADGDQIIFKLLTGRMKGQAFVTFPDVDTARKALDLVHGYEFKGKPVIIQYGKKTAA